MKTPFDFPCVLRLAGCAVLVLSGFLPGAGLCAAAASPLRVLILSGQNNHDWKTTTPKLQAILEASGHFSVSVTEHPEQNDAAALAGQDLLLSNWNAWGKQAELWPEPVRQAYLDFVRAGKGLVVVHAGSSSFSDWADYQAVAGASWKLGQTKHGPPREFTVQPVEREHPVMRGLEPFRTLDELWEKPGVQPSARVLARGDGEPVALATEFGKGRGFTLLLGHSSAFMENPGFQALLLRGAEWAATGAVARTAMAATAPPVDEVLRAVAGYRFGEDRRALLALERLAQAASADPAKRVELAGKLRELVTGKETTLEGKQQALWQFSLLAGPGDEAFLKGLAGQAELGYYAGNALARLAGSHGWKTEEELRRGAQKEAEGWAGAPGQIVAALTGPDRSLARRALSLLRAAEGPVSLQAAREAFRRAAPSEQAQIVALLGDRGEPAALPLLLEAARSGDALVRQTAILALGLACDASAVPFLVEALGARPEEERNGAAESLARLRGEGVDEAMAAAMGNAVPAVQRELARALALRGAKSAVPALLRAAGAADPGLRAEAGAALGRLGDPSLCPSLLTLLDRSPEAAAPALAAICRRSNSVQPLLEALPDAPDAQQAKLLSVLGATGLAPALEALRAAVQRGPAGARTAAVRALADWPDGAAFGDLAALAGSLEAPVERTLAVRGLSRMAALVSDRSPEQLAADLEKVMKQTGANERKALLGALGKLSGAEALRVAQSYAGDAEVGAEAKAAVQQIQAAGRARQTGKRLGSASEAQMKLFDRPDNLCRGALVSSPTGHRPDGHGDLPFAAVDGDGGTYWDEVDRQELYVFRVQFVQPAKAGLLRILGFQHQSFAPRSFEIRCDGKTVQKVEDAVYQDNVFSVDFPATDCRVLELHITRSYGASPAMREFGIFPPRS